MKDSSFLPSNQYRKDAGCRRRQRNPPPKPATMPIRTRGNAFLSAADPGQGARSLARTAPQAKTAAESRMAASAPREQTKDHNRQPARVRFAATPTHRKARLPQRQPLQPDTGTPGRRAPTRTLAYPYRFPLRKAEAHASLVSSKSERINSQNRKRPKIFPNGFGLMENRIGPDSASVLPILARKPSRKKSFFSKKSLDPNRNADNIVVALFGALAQLGERMTGSHEVRGSIPLCSTKFPRPASQPAFFMISTCTQCCPTRKRRTL